MISLSFKWLLEPGLLFWDEQYMSLCELAFQPVVSFCYCWDVRPHRAEAWEWAISRNQRLHTLFLYALCDRQTVVIENVWGLESHSLEVKNLFCPASNSLSNLDNAHNYPWSFVNKSSNTYFAKFWGELATLCGKGIVSYLAHNKPSVSEVVVL